VIAQDLRADAAEVLRRCQMPEVEIEWVLTADHPVVHMLLELHLERLEEELAERRKALGEFEARLIGEEANSLLGAGRGKTVISFARE
jgi:hypothetical protein